LPYEYLSCLYIIISLYLHIVTSLYRHTLIS